MLLWSYQNVSIQNVYFSQLFFEGVQAKVGAGVKESEVSYQMAFSKQELRRVVKEYPAREVKKGLENLYRKVEKHLCEEENLLQVWIEYRRKCKLYLLQFAPVILIITSFLRM